MNYQNPELQRAHDLGTQAAELGLGWYTCPYPDDTLRKVIWQQGYNAVHYPSAFAPGVVEVHGRPAAQSFVARAARWAGIAALGLALVATLFFAAGYLSVRGVPWL